MRKIFYPILLLALIACKGQQQTADSESVADPATECLFLFNVSTLELFFQHTNLFLIN